MRQVKGGVYEAKKQPNKSKIMGSNNNTPFASDSEANGSKKNKNKSPPKRTKKTYIKKYIQLEMFQATV